MCTRRGSWIVVGGGSALVGMVAVGGNTEMEQWMRNSCEASNTDTGNRHRLSFLESCDSVSACRVFGVLNISGLIPNFHF